MALISWHSSGGFDWQMELELGVKVWSAGRANAISISAARSSGRAELDQTKPNQNQKQNQTKSKTDKWLLVQWLQSCVRALFSFGQGPHQAQTQSSLFAARSRLTKQTQMPANKTVSSRKRDKTSITNGQWYM